jgi:hypothetical protein
VEKPEEESLEEKCEQLVEKCLQLERDLEDMRRPIRERSTEELLQSQRETLAEIGQWLDGAQEVPTPPGRHAIRTLFNLYERRAWELQVLRADHAGVRKVALDSIRIARQKISKLEAAEIAEHKRADEAVLDLRNEVGRERALMRLGIYNYLKHISQIDIGTVMTPAGREIVGIVAEWVKNGLDVEWEAKRQEKLDDKTLTFGISWEEKCVFFGHAPFCEKIYYENSNVCSCGRELWDKAQATQSLGENDGETREANDDPPA